LSICCKTQIPTQKAASFACAPQSESGKITITVKDNGSGIAPELLPHVFERGVTKGGSGVGLFLCKTVVESHGGIIQIESEEGAGTAVTFTLPVYQGQYGGAKNDRTKE
jgi:signal transduction histidine kinase